MWASRCCCVKCSRPVSSDATQIRQQVSFRGLFLCIQVSFDTCGRRVAAALSAQGLLALVSFKGFFCRSLFVVFVFVVYRSILKRDLYTTGFCFCCCRSLLKRDLYTFFCRSLFVVFCFCCIQVSFRGLFWCIQVSFDICRRHVAAVQDL